MLGLGACDVGSVTGPGGAGDVDGGQDTDSDPGDVEADAGVELSFDYDTSGRWLMPPALEAMAEEYEIGYDGPPPWNGGANCGGSFMPGTMALGDLLASTYPQIYEIGGYSCRQNTANSAETSVHGTGRAMDLMIAVVDGDADNEAGDVIANWLVYHAETLGVQLVIWDHSSWIGVGADKLGRYSGPIPHIDHIHVELTEAAAQ